MPDGGESATLSAQLDDIHLQPQALGALRLRGFFTPGCQSTAAARALSEVLARVPLLLVDLKNAHLTAPPPTPA